MRLIINIILLFIFLALLLYLGAYLFLVGQGKKIVLQQANQWLNRDISYASIDFSFPLRFEFRGVEIGENFRADAIIIKPSVFGFLQRKLVLRYVAVHNPKLKIKRSAPLSDGTENLPGPVSEAIQFPKRIAIRSFDPIIKHVVVQDGDIEYVDKNVTPEGVTVNVSGVSADIFNVYEYPSTVITHFDISGNVPGNEENRHGKIAAQGWINLLKRDMKAKIDIRGIDALPLYPYYAGWVHIDRNRIDTAVLNFHSDITGLNNDVSAACHIEVSEIVFRKPKEDEQVQREERIAQKVIDIFKSLNDGNIVLDYTFKTTMSNPIFGLESIRSAVEDKITEARRSEGGLSTEKVIGFPGKVFEGTARGVGELSKAVITGVASVGNEIGRALSSSFHRDRAVVEPVPVGAANTTANETVLESR
jgi:hypothetical protein